MVQEIKLLAWLEHAWTAQRICNVGGELASPILPTSGIPPGDPTSGRVLSVLLKPWHDITTAQGVHPAANAGNRSIKATGTDCADAEAKVVRALVAIVAFDKSIDLIENLKKRLSWKSGQSAEHLGIPLHFEGLHGWKAMPASHRSKRLGLHHPSQTSFIVAGKFKVSAWGYGCLHHLQVLLGCAFSETAPL